MMLPNGDTRPWGTLEVEYSRNRDGSYNRRILSEERYIDDGEEEQGYIDAMMGNASREFSLAMSRKLNQ